MELAAVVLPDKQAVAKIADAVHIGGVKAAADDAQAAHSREVSEVH